jgi:hypothetical protein
VSTKASGEIGRAGAELDIGDLADDDGWAARMAAAFRDQGHD